MHDNRMWRTVAADPAMAAAWFLLAGYAYEVLDSPIITDGSWDELCRFIEKNREAVAQHRHAPLIDYEALPSGTAGYLREEYLPEITKSAARRLAAEAAPKPRKKRR